MSGHTDADTAQHQKIQENESAGSTCTLASSIVELSQFTDRFITHGAMVPVGGGHTQAALPAHGGYTWRRHGEVSAHKGP